VEEGKEVVPAQTVKCKLCGGRITGYDFPERMAKLRRHYKRRHPAAFRRSIRKGVKKRKEAS